MRYQDSENVLNSNQKSSSYHLSGSVDQHGIRQEFCTKVDQQTGKGDWPLGQYCIYRYGTRCPDGLKEGKSNCCFFFECTSRRPVIGKAEMGLSSI